MAMYLTPEEHAANPPATWAVVKHGRRWQLVDKAGAVLDTFDTKGKAEAARHQGFIASLYAKEGRWFAGERVETWKPYQRRA